MDPLIVAFTGPSNSGKTTLIVKLSNLLGQNHRVAIIKHDPKDKGVFDVEGKDSFKFSATGAEVVVTSSKRTTLFSNHEKSFDEIIGLFSPFDILFVEGLKTLPLPRIAVFKDEIDENYFENCEAVAVKKGADLSKVPSFFDVLDVNDEADVASWILKKVKNIAKAKAK